MFACRECVELLQDFLEGDMPDEDRKHLEEHLAACPPCVEFLRTYRATPQICRKALAARMPSELAAKLKAFLRDKCRR